MRIGRYKGRHLKPRAHPLAAPAAAGTATALLLSSSPADAAVHRVRSGDTLSAIGARYGVAVGKIARVNGLRNPNHIVVGHKLRIPGGKGGGRGGGTYVVRRGDTVSAIAGRFGTTSRAIARRNRLQNVNLIRVGQRLRLPAGARRRPAASGLQRTSRARIGSLLHREAVAHGVNPALVKAVAWQESGWKQPVVSSAGAIGVMQVMPGTADYVNTVLRHGNLNVRRTRDNIHLGVAYLRHMLRLFGGNERKALAAYYSGPGNVKRRLNRIQRPYVRSVRALKRRF